MRHRRGQRRRCHCAIDRDCGAAAGDCPAVVLAIDRRDNEHAARRQRPAAGQGLVEGHCQRRFIYRRAGIGRAHPVHSVARACRQLRVPQLRRTRSVAGRVCDRPAVQRQCVRTDRNAVRIRIALSHRVTEHQRGRPAARVVHRVLCRRAQCERDARPRYRITGCRHGHRLRERRGDLNVLADRIEIVRPRRRTDGDRVRNRKRRQHAVHLVARVVIDLGEAQICVHRRPGRPDRHARRHAQFVREERDPRRRYVARPHCVSEFQRRGVRLPRARVEGHVLLAGVPGELQLQHRTAPGDIHRRVERHPRPHGVARLVGVVLPRRRRRHQRHPAHCGRVVGRDRA